MESFEVPIPLHAACGLLGNEGIHIVGGKLKEDRWLPYHYYYDLIHGEMSRI